MIKADAETAFLLHLTGSLYKNPRLAIPRLRDVKFASLLWKAMENKIAFHVCGALLKRYSDQLPEKRCAYLHRFIRRGEEKMEKLAEVTGTLESCLNEYVIHKTYRGYPAILNDIDVLVPSLEEALKSLLSEGMTITEIGEHKAMLTSNGQKVHVHDEISWANSTFLDNRLIYERPRNENLWNVKVRVPNVEADALIFMAHINFEPLHFTISDFIYLCRIAPIVDWNIVLNQAKRYHWIRTLAHTLLLFDQVYQKVYCRSSPFGTCERTASPSRKRPLSFPVMIPRRLVVKAFLEKKLFGYLVRKISKCAYILLTGDNYRAFCEPPEQNLTPQNIRQ